MPGSLGIFDDMEPISGIRMGGGARFWCGVDVVRMTTLVLIFMVGICDVEIGSGWL